MSDENKIVIQSSTKLRPTLTMDVRANTNGNRVKSSRWLYTLIVLIVVLVIILLGWNLYTQNKLKKVEGQLQQKQVDPQAESKKQSQDLIDKVGQLIVLPKDEQPTIATVSDLDKLAGQPFFANAQLGDKVLIYHQAKKAILYRPSENKIIELAPLIDNQNSTQPSSSETSPATAPATAN